MSSMTKRGYPHDTIYFSGKGFPPATKPWNFTYFLSFHTPLGLDLGSWIAIANQSQFSRSRFCVNHFTIKVLRYLLRARNTRNETTTRDKSFLKGLGFTEGESWGISMMLKIGTEVSQYYNVFNYGPPRPQKDISSQDRTIVSGPGVKLELAFFYWGISKRNLGRNMKFLLH